MSISDGYDGYSLFLLKHFIAYNRGWYCKVW